MNTTTPNEHPSAIVKVDTSNFSEEVLQSAEPVIVDFWKNGCQPCDMIAPFLEQIATELAGKVKVVKINKAENPELVARYGVRGYPTLALFKHGEVAVAAIDFGTGSFRSSILNALASLRT
ncbi:thioredoxin domain-containing protein [Sinorhizobium meliloti]|uniref:thioredoxin domain-containing protein n=1 Tax=Rhizobium meliloti TaxID=382 RepID=UPI000FD8AD6F|nr:thioredoxin domain-containing protein [Sinorhizobium meliloti]RVG51345.1 thiol reductase thioredoxin [Sinorhizobium meliloti]WQP13238.1 thioredoxin domain-containing protein [Sinorhizobium meliloti]WQP26714.1 thioredoxin domain-containing protein [Sinorhizobium meliloti]